MTKDIELEPLTNDQAWAAGVLSVMGSFLLVDPKKGPPNVRLVLKTTRSTHRDAFYRLADALSVDVATGPYNGKVYWSIQLSGKPLHVVMTLLWPEITPSRKREYAGLRKQLKARLEELEAEVEELEAEVE